MFIQICNFYFVLTSFQIVTRKSVVIKTKNRNGFTTVCRQIVKINYTNESASGQMITCSSKRCLINDDDDDHNAPNRADLIGNGPAGPAQSTGILWEMMMKVKKKQTCRHVKTSELGQLVSHPLSCD